jgi:hypothetical protein
VTARKSTSRVALIGAAAAALLLGHWTAYVLAYRQVSLRDIILAQTGHSYLAPIGKLTFVFLFLSLAWVSAESCDFMAVGNGTPLGLRSLWRRLVLIQIAGFTLLELIERVIAHAPLFQMFSHYTYALGLLLQVTTALLAAVAIMTTAGTVSRACSLMSAGRTRIPARRRALGRAPLATRIAIGTMSMGASGVRGPPQASLS